MWIALLALLAAACGGAQERPEPPSGAVDPGIHGLATPGDSGAKRSASPADPGHAAALGGIAAALPSGLPGMPPVAGPANQASPPRTGEATGAITMTREHCDALGRKFAELAMAQAGAAGASPTGEAAEVGKSFAERCARDMAGQSVDVREYQCMLRATAANDLLGCKR